MRASVRCEGASPSAGSRCTNSLMLGACSQTGSVSLPSMTMGLRRGTAMASIDGRQRAAEAVGGAGSRRGRTRDQQRAEQAEGHQRSRSREPSRIPHCRREQSRDWLA